MSALSPSASPLHACDRFSAFGEARRIRLLIRHGDGQQQLDRHAERTGDLLMQRNGAFALPGLELRQVALGDADGIKEIITNRNMMVRS
jgi:hypothetical protein